MSVRRMLPFVLLNIVVSSVVVLAILYWWDGRQGDAAATAASSTVTVMAPDIDPAVTPVPGAELPAAAGGATSEASTEDAAADGPTVYVVQAGDTLGKISEFFDVPQVDIMEANEISNPNILSVGEELIIPIGGLPTPVPTETAVATVNVPPTPIPTLIPDAGQVQIEITEVVGAGSLADEAVTIANLGSRPVGLQGWSVADDVGHVYTFGQVTLFGDGAAILLHTETGANGPSDQYWGLEEAIWQSGATVTLRDAEGTVQATFVVGE